MADKCVEIRQIVAVVWHFIFWRRRSSAI